MCECQDEQCPLSQFETESIARAHIFDVCIDMQLWRCSACSAEWLHCSIDDAANMGWTRWYRSPAEPVPDERTLESAAEEMMGAPWHYYGGPYYRTSGERTFGAPPLQSILYPEQMESEEPDEAEPEDFWLRQRVPSVI